jgi:prepilin-type N-terminal cleavage/methylation domain-containing protein
MAAARSRAGFSLIEIMISIILVGMSITALVVANNAFTMANGAGADLSTAEFLIEQIRELTTMLPVSNPEATSWVTFGPEEASLADYDDIDDFDNATFSPPISATSRTALSDFTGFSQHVTVKKVNPSDFGEELQVTDSRFATSDFIRVTVGVSLNGNLISSTSWIRARR